MYVSIPERSTTDGWIDLRSGSGRLLARLDTARGLLEVVRNGERTVIDLWRYMPPHGIGSPSPMDASVDMVRAGKEKKRN